MERALSESAAAESQVAALRLRRVLQSLVLLGSGTGIAQGLMAVNALLLARYLGPGLYGMFAATFSAVVLSSFLFNWGLDAWLLKEGAVAQSAVELAGAVLGVKGALGVLWGVSMFFLLPELSPNVFVRPLVLVSILDVWCEGLFSTQLATLNALTRMSAFSFLMALSRAGRLLSAVVLIVVGVQSPVFFAAGRLFATSVGLVIALAVLRPAFVSGWFTKSRQIFKQAFPFALSDLLAKIYLQVDVTMLAILLGDNRMVGLYATASSLVSALFVIPVTGYSVMVPVLASLIHAKYGRLRQVIERMLLASMAVGLVLWISLGLGGGALTRLFLGEGYQTSGELLIWLSPILFLKSLSFAGAAVLVSVGWQHRRVVVQMISALANVLLNLLLIPRFGIWAAAGIYVTSEMALAIGYVGVAARWLYARPRDA